MPDASAAAHLLGAAALALGFALLALRGGPTVIRTVALQAIAVGLAAAGLAAADRSFWLGLAALVLLAGHAVMLPRAMPVPPVRHVRAVLPALAAAFVVLLLVALPHAAVAGLPVRRDDLAVALGTGLIGALAAVARSDPAWHPVGLLALANGVALAAVAGGDPPIALAVTVLSLAPVGAALLRPGRAA